METRTLIYCTPQTEVIEIEMEQTVLQGSKLLEGEDGGDNNPFN